MKTITTLFNTILLITIFTSTLVGQITGTFTADNSYAAYVGNYGSVGTKVLPVGTANGHSNTTASQIFSPTQNSFSAQAGDYLYIIAWSDDMACQGLLGEFTGDKTIRTGDVGWEVYATDKNYNNNQAPSPSLINKFITSANQFNSWSKPFVGPYNGKATNACRSYRKVNGISTKAKWVWYDSNNSNSAKKVFGTGTNHKEFLIFRFPVKKIINGGSAGTGQTTGPSFSKCDCIPEDIYSVDLTSNMFFPKNISGPLNNFTYKLKYKGHPHMANLGDSWNAWINAKYGLSGNKSCQVVHQYILYKYTKNSSGGIQNEQMIEEFWVSPAYLPSTQTNFNATLNSNTNYYIKHGVYYGRKDGGKCSIAEKCPWEESKFFLSTSSGPNPKIMISDEKGRSRKMHDIKLRN